MIQQQMYKLTQGTTLSTTILTQYITLFWTDIFAHLSNRDNIHLLILCKVQFHNGETRTLAHMRRCNFTDKDLFTNYLVSRLGGLNDTYKDTPIISITLDYNICDGLAAGDRLLSKSEEYTVVKYNYNNMQLPLSMNPADYGTIINTQDMGDKVRYVVQDSQNRVIQIDVYGTNDNTSSRYNEVYYLAPVDLKYVDTLALIGNGFTRQIGKDTQFIDHTGVVVYKEKEIPAKPFNKINLDKKISDASVYCTIDIETVNIEGNQIPYLICGYVYGKHFYSYANDLSEKSQVEMFKSFFSQLIEHKNIKYVYAHNLSGFDGVFILKHLLAFGAYLVKPIIFNGKLIGIVLKIQDGDKEDKFITIKFKDSLLLLPMSLRKLCKSFNVPTPKTHFPFKLTDINYNGPFPAYELFTDISREEYDLIKKEHGNRVWSFREEAIKYCSIDCVALFDIIFKFNELIFNQFSLNVHGSLTLPSLAMKIYKSSFMTKNTIYQILGRVEWDIRESYTGGAVDVYINHNGNNQNLLSGIKNKLYYYDVNSLYPNVMASLQMPVGKPIAFEGDITKYWLAENKGFFDDENIYFFYCKITSPKFMMHPILQRRIKTADGVRTIAGLGTWTGWISSYEYQVCEPLGYKFEILNGYKFKKANIFSEYVKKLYEIRLTYSKSDPLNLVAKLLMNSLYGKFGMKSESSGVEVYDVRDEFTIKLLQEHLDKSGESISDILRVGDYYILQTSQIHYRFDDKEDMYHGLDVNVAIASTVTAGARCLMSQVKNTGDMNVYYTDTDSIITDSPLAPSLVGDKLGQFKLECEITRAVFLAPKVYGIITTDGDEIIKVKGLTKNAVKDIHVSDLRLLLIKDADKKIEQVKWNKTMFEGKIEILKTSYKLRASSNKRMPVYVPNQNPQDLSQWLDILTKTKPYIYNEIEVK